MMPPGHNEERVTAPSTHETVIRAGNDRSRYWRDLWSYRELLAFLTLRDLLVRYKQTIIGIAWAVLQPAIMVAIFFVVFRRLGRMPSNNAPYPISVLAALLPWQFVSRAFADSSTSLITNRNLVSKVYFPRALIPGASVLVGVVDFAIAFSLLAGLMLWYGFSPGPRAFAVFILIPAAVLAALGPALWIAALTVKYRDFRYIVPFMVQVGLFVSPIGFSTSLIPARWLFLYSLNPVVGVIDGFRWALANGDPPRFIVAVVSWGSAAVLLFTGARYFRKMEQAFADMV